MLEYLSVVDRYIVLEYLFWIGIAIALPLIFRWFFGPLYRSRAILRVPARRGQHEDCPQDRTGS